MSYKDIIKNNNVPFDEIFIPSKGIFYNNKKDTFLVKYLTGKEENLLTSPSLLYSGKALEMVMTSCVLDWEGDIKNLLIGDRNAFMIYLRSTSYGDNINFNYNCSSCNAENEVNFKLSSLEMKDMVDLPDDSGNFSFILPKMKLSSGDSVIIKFRPKTLGDEINIMLKVESEKKILGDVIIDKNIEITYQNQITSINGNKDKRFINNILKTMPLGDSFKLREYMELVEPGVQENIINTCNYCHKQQINKIPINHNFFGLGDEYRKHMMEEIFLISYYGKGGFSRDDVFNMPIYERRWVIQRIQEEVERKNEADRNAAKKK